MQVDRAAVALLAATALLAPGLASADCKLVQLAEFHVDPNARVPVVDGSIDGKPIKVMFDTGASFSFIPHHEADRLGLTLQPLVGAHAYGIGGESTMYAALVRQLKIDQFVRANIDLRVAGDQGAQMGVALVLGDDFFSNFDMELDLAHHAIRLFAPQGCTPPQLIYWRRAYSQARLLAWNRDAPAAQTEAFVNGKRVLAGLDTGAVETILDSGVATADGVRPEGGASAIRGISAASVPTWVGHLDSFVLGDEKVNNVRVTVANLVGSFNYAETGSIVPRRLASTPGMLVGEDFLHAHRVYIDVKDHLILFSYEGGPVFTPQTPAAPPK